MFALAEISGFVSGARKRLIACRLGPRWLLAFPRRACLQTEDEERYGPALGKFLSILLLLLPFEFFFLASSPAFAATTAADSGAARGECLSIDSRVLGRAVPYCALLPPSYSTDKTRRYPVLYMLHGLGDNAQMLLRSGGFDLLQDLWEQKKVGEFIVVTPAGYASFYINSRDGRQRYEDFFLREFIPRIESRYRVRTGRMFRGISGFSMGGYGALHLAFSHPELFGSVSAHSAALVETSKLPEAASAQAPEPAFMAVLGDVFGSPIDRAFWERNNPLDIARHADLAGLKIYFDCGAQDDYGFNVGAQALDRILTSRHILHEFHLYPGGHNGTYFAEHWPASLQFHSRAFGLAASLHEAAAMALPLWDWALSRRE